MIAMNSIITVVKKIVGFSKVTEKMIEKDDEYKKLTKEDKFEKAIKKAGYEKLDPNSLEDHCVLARIALILEANQVKNGQKVETIILPKNGELKAGIIGFSIERLDRVEYKIFRTNSHIDSITEEVVDPLGIDDYVEIEGLIKLMRNEENITIVRMIPGLTISVKIDNSIYFRSMQNNKMIFEKEVKGEHKIIMEKVNELIKRLLVNNKEIIIKS